MYVTVVVSSRQLGIGNGLTYAASPQVTGFPTSPAGLRGAGRCQVGQLVKVPLRKKLVEGIIVETSEKKPEGNFDVKEIAEFLDDIPLLSSTQIATAKWMAEYYLCTLRQALGVFIPGWQWGKLLPEKEEWIRRVENGRLGKKQVMVLEFLQGRDWVRWKEMQEELGIGRDVLKRLVAKGMVEMKREMSQWGLFQHAPTGGEILLPSDVTLTPRQTIASKATASDPRPTLLFGITGSGKTEIYAALIGDVVRDGRSAVLLLPEILLTENFIERFQQLLDRSVIAVIHSRLTLAKRREEWRRCRAGDIRLVIGSRSALFYPLQNLGLIIIDEEHEWTYKNEQAPRYHAVKVAEQLCGYVPEQVGMTNDQSTITKQFPIPNSQFPKLVLGSASPSVDSWYKAKCEKYQLVELPERYGGASLPSVQVVDLGTIAFGQDYPFSPTLINAIRRRLERHEQVVLFLNRRGFATSLLCLACRYRFEDSVSKLPYIVHYRGSHPYLQSHHTGEELPIPSHCPRCQSVTLRPVGAGTQRIESILERMFPSARILRADADTLKHPEHMRLLLDKMKTGKADILLGTQSVVKGLDLPHVTLAAVLLADVGLSLPHFRAGERVFQLLTQLIGRSGRRPRAESRGEVIIQTFRPQALEVEFAARHDVRSYLEQELNDRQRAHYPPETQLVRFVFSGSKAMQLSREFSENLAKGGQIPDIKAQVTRAPSLFSGTKVWQVELRGQGIHGVLRKLPRTEAMVDVDPVECL